MKGLNLFLILIILSSCNSHKDKTENDFEVINLNWLKQSDSVNIYKNYSLTYDNYDQIKTPYILLSYMNGDCGSCMIKLKNWNKWKKNIDLKKYSCVVILGTEDIVHLKFVLEKAKFDFPIVIDSGKYLESNFPNISLNQTLLIKNDVVLERVEFDSLYLNNKYLNSVFVQ